MVNSTQTFLAWILVLASQVQAAEIAKPVCLSEYNKFNCEVIGLDPHMFSGVILSRLAHFFTVVQGQLSLFSRPHPAKFYILN